MPSAARSSLALHSLTILAMGFLAFDGAAMMLLGWWLRQPVVVVIGAVLLASSGLVLVYWHRHQRQAGEIAAARRALADEARSLQDLVRRN